MFEKGFAEPEKIAVRWYHLKDDFPGKMTIINDNYCHFWGHYFDKRMRVCNENNCVFCASGIGRQRRYIFDIVLLNDGNQYLYETSETIALQIRDIISNTRTEGRIFFEVRRLSPSKHSNCKVKRIFEDTDIDFEDYEPKNIKKIMDSQEEYYNKTKPETKYKKPG